VFVTYLCTGGQLYAQKQRKKAFLNTLFYWRKTWKDKGEEGTARMLKI